MTSEINADKRNPDKESAAQQFFLIGWLKQALLVYLILK